MKTKRLTLLLSFALITATVLSCSKNQENPPIRFAFQNRVGSAIPVVAVEKGFFASRGLNVKPLRFNNGPACAEAIYSGSADVGTMGDTAAIICASRTDNLVMVTSHSTGEHRHRLMVQNGSPCSRLKDLQGKRIGLKKGTSTYGGFLAAVAAQGLDPKSFTVVDLSPSTLPEALAAGSIDAFAASEPTPSMGEVTGGSQILTFGGLGNNYPIMLLAKKRLAAERSQDFKAFMEALKEAEEFINANPDETAQIMARTTHLPLTVIASAMARHTYRLTMDDSITQSLLDTALFLKKSGKIDQVPDIAALTM